MRKLKFRAWDEDEKIIRNISCIFWNTLEWYISRFELDGKDMKSGMPIMQFTGLKDKNGKEIYEGDILSYELKQGWEIFFEDGFYYMMCGGHSYLLEKVRAQISEIIGNIYENPKLLEKQ